MFKSLLAFALGFSVLAVSAQSEDKLMPVPKAMEPKRPLITYVDPSDIVLISTPGEPTAIRIACSTLKGKGEVAVTIGGATIIFPVNCPVHPTPPFN